MGRSGEALSGHHLLASIEKIVDSERASDEEDPAAAAAAAAAGACCTTTTTTTTGLRRYAVTRIHHGVTISYIPICQQSAVPSTGIELQHHG